MSVISDFMKRFGWVRISEAQQLQTTQDNWSFVPEAKVDPAACFDPSLATLAAGSQETTALDVMAEDPDEKAWKAAVARAKAQSEAEEAETQKDHQTAAPQEAAAQEAASEEAAPEEDWDALMEAARLRAEADVADTQPDAEAPSEEEDWDALMLAARQRAETKETPVPDPLPPPPVAEQEIDAAAAQVEQGTKPANDDRPKVKLVSVPSMQDSDEEEEWKKLRAEVEARDKAEAARKQRAMREIRRLRGNRGKTRNGRPPGVPAKRRLAAGTTPPPRKATTQGQTPLVMAPGPVKAPTPKVSVPAASSATLPRITKRLKH
jgi:hypothetical protein